MIRKAFSVLALMMSMLCVNAQPNAELPLQEGVKTGKLPNGLTYYILHNEEPKDRANFYIAQKVGSTLEEPTQYGLAHFLEHMAFNGTAHYPGKSMLDYLQSKGIRFGADINAYTYYDETVYNINNVNTKDKALMDSVLLAIYDWSGSILLEDAEIDAERGVIEEEWRMRNNAQFRLLENVLPQIYTESQYQTPVIGKMEVIRNFPYSEIKNYYQKWYRPDQQGIVIVGDFDADEMEKEVVKLFSTIPMPENAASRIYPTVSDNQKPIFAYFEDPELRLPRVDLSFKYEKPTFEERNTIMGFLKTEVMYEVITDLIDNRLQEYAEKPECKYMQAGVYFGDFWVSKTKGAFNIIVIAKENAEEAFSEALAIIARACKTGFTDSELERVTSEILSKAEKKANEKDKTDSDVLGAMLYRHFIDNAPALGAEGNYQILQQFLPALPVQQINMIAAELLTPENQVIVVSQPKKEGMTVITEESFVANTEKILNAEYEAYQDEKITDPLISNFLKPGKIAKESKGAFETTEFILSNGVKVVVKPTDFKADEVRLTAFTKGGKKSYSPSQALTVQLASDAADCSKLGNFTRPQLRKYLAGKQVGVGFDIGNVTNNVYGNSTVKDLETMFQMVYAYFVELTKDPEQFEISINQAKTAIKSAESNPMFIYEVQQLKTLYGDNPMFNQVTAAQLEEANYDQSFELVKKSLSNAADYTFVIVGNVDLEALKPMLEKYIASLPANAKKLTKVEDLCSINYVKGEVADIWKQPMQAPTTIVTNVYSGLDLPYTIKNAEMLSMVGSLLRNIYLETLREEEGGTYSPSAYGVLSPINNQWEIRYKFTTNADQQEKMMTRAHDELLKLLNEGTTAEAFGKVKEAQLANYDQLIRNNGYWTSYLSLYLRGIDSFTNARQIIEGITVDDMNAFMKTLYNGDNRVRVVMEGVAE